MKIKKPNRNDYNFGYGHNMADQYHKDLLRSQTKVIMHFHCAGVVSDEEVDIIEETDETITVDDNGVKRMFDKKTGNCLNDNTDFGAKRTI